MIVNKNLKIFYSIAAFIFPFILYVATLAPSVTFIDSGELAAVATKLGVAHPTGYPLFTVIGNVFTKLPVGDPVYRLNLMCAFLSSFAIMLFFNMLLSLTVKIADGLKESKLSETILLNVSLAASLVLAYSRTFWDTANAIEVYSLHTVLLIANLFLILKASGEIDRNSELTHDRFWLVFAFVLGLSFTNHLSTIFLSVGCLYLYFAVNGFGQLSFKRIMLMTIPFLLGISVYVYLVVRADNEILSWGNPHNFENFWRHFTGKQFSVWMFSSFENAEKQFTYFTKNFPMEYAVFPLMFAVPGLFLLFKEARRIFNFTLLLFLFCIIYAINYDIYDIDSYFLLAFIVAVIWVCMGLLWLVSKVKDNASTISFAFLLLPLMPLVMNFEKTDESKNYFVDDYTNNVFKSADKNAIIMSTQWDFWISSSIYQQFVRNIRPDIAVIDKELLRKSWYFEYLKKHYPDICEKSKVEIDAYLTELLKFEKNTARYTSPKSEADRQDLMKIQTTFLALLNSFIDKNYPERTFYTTLEIEQDKNEKFGKDYSRVPQGLLFRYTREKGFDNYKNPEFDYDITQRSDYHHNFIMNAYYSAYLNRANFLMNYSQFDDAEASINKALELKPGSPEAIQLQSKCKQLKSLSNNEVK
ncbi:MAG: DUF2723 domain-containing protein [Ignavibacteria bacterium]|nr:DUF2723 domain-containing protein [Ignavibacteria bacterium]